MKDSVWDERSPLRGKCDKERDGEKNHPERKRGDRERKAMERGEKEMLRKKKIK